MELTYKDLFHAMRKRWFVILAAFIIGTLIATVASTLIVKKEYTSNSRAFITVEKESETVVAMTDKTATLHCTTQISTYSIYQKMAVLLKSKVAFATADNLQAAISAKVVNAEINVVDISCVWTNPQDAQLILQTFNAVLSETLSGLPFDKQTIVLKIQSEPTLPTQKSSPNVLLWVVQGALIGLAAGCIATILYEYRNKKIRSEKDLDELSIPVLGGVKIK